MKNVVITGANRGLGFEFARAYAAQGCTVFALARSRSDALDELAKQDNVSILHGDLTRPDDLQAIARQLDDVAIDLLVNNAGVMGSKTFSESGKAKQGLHDFDRDEWRYVFEANVFTPAHLTALLLPSLSDGAKVVTISSSMGSISGNEFGGWFAYRASKAAVNALVKSTALELADRNIIALALHPGWVRTDMGGPNADLDIATSVAGMMQVIAGLRPEDSGSFRAFDGSVLPY
jgi:NAD(P)-dependent dehydrogenase (short-subunit alcohol dehydrogenase family)